MEIKEKRNKVIEFLAYLGISFLISVLSLSIFPSFFDVYLNSYSRAALGTSVSLSISLAGIFILTSLIFKELGRYTVKKAIAKTVMMLGIFMTVICIIGALSGFMAEFIYAKYSNVKTLEEIKGRIDLISKVIAIFVIPLGISFFWRLATGNPGKDAKHYLPTASQYIKLVLLSIALMAVGFTVHLALPESEPRIISAILLTTIGVVSFYISKRICYMAEVPFKEGN